MQDPVIATRTARPSTYLAAFFITAAIFAAAIFVSGYLDSRRVADIRATQEDISTDILSLETQFELLKQRSCRDISEDTILPSVLSSLGGRLSYMEAHDTGSAEEVLRLKRLYSLLEIKDYLLMKQIAVRCSIKPVFVLYFYSNEGDCPDCEKQGYVLTALAEKYPALRIYSFDYRLDVSALQTLITIDNVGPHLPAIVTGGTAYYGFHDVAAIEKIIPIKTLKSATSSSEKR